MTWVAGSSPVADHSRATALASWRAVAGLVAIRWQAYLDAEAENRPSAFASYLVALDTEEAEAAEVAILSSSVAA